MRLGAELFLCDREHLGREVDADGGRNPFGREQSCDLVARACGEIEQAQRALRQKLSGFAAPALIHSERENPVDPVVGGRDRIEHLPTFLLGGLFFPNKMGGKEPGSRKEEELALLEQDGVEIAASDE